MVRYCGWFGMKTVEQSIKDINNKIFAVDIFYKPENKSDRTIVVTLIVNT